MANDKKGMVFSPGKTEAERSGLSPLSLAVVLTGFFLAATDLFIVNVALPSIGTSLHAGTAELELVVAGYTAAYACLLVAGGRLGDLHGRRRMFMLGMAGFVASSVLCGFALTGLFLVFARIIQGMAAAAMVPQVLATIQATASGARRQRAIATYAATVGIATIFGEVMGGLLISANIAGLSWRPLFLLNVPIGLTALLAARRFLPETRADQPGRVDVLGSLLLAATLVTLIVPLSIGESLQWPWWCFLVLSLAAPALLVFWRVERKKQDQGFRDPLVPPRLLGVRDIRKGLLVALAFFPSAGGFLFVSSIVLQTGWGHTPLQAGLALTPYAAGFFAAALFAPGLARRLGHWVISVGAGVLAAALVILAIQCFLAQGVVESESLAPTLAFIGFGQGLVMVPLFGVVLTDVPTAQAGVASGVLVTTQQAGLALGAALFGSLVYLVQDVSDNWAFAAGWIFALQAIFALTTGIAAKTLRRSQNKR